MTLIANAADRLLAAIVPHTAVMTFNVLEKSLSVHTFRP